MIHPSCPAAEEIKTKTKTNMVLAATSTPGNLIYHTLCKLCWTAGWTQCGGMSSSFHRLLTFARFCIVPLKNSCSGSGVGDPHMQVSISCHCVLGWQTSHAGTYYLLSILSFQTWAGGKIRWLSLAAITCHAHSSFLIACSAFLPSRDTHRVV